MLNTKSFTVGVCTVCCVIVHGVEKLTMARAMHSNDSFDDCMAQIDCILQYADTLNACILKYTLPKIRDANAKCKWNFKICLTVFAFISTFAKGTSASHRFFSIVTRTICTTIQKTRFTAITRERERKRKKERKREGEGFVFYFFGFIPNFSVRISCAKLILSFNKSEWLADKM